MDTVYVMLMVIVVFLHEHDTPQSIAGYVLANMTPYASTCTSQLLVKGHRLGNYHKTDKGKATMRRCN